MIGLTLMGLGVVIVCAAFICLKTDLDVHFTDLVLASTTLMVVGYFVTAAESVFNFLGMK